MYKKRGYCDRGKIVANLACLHENRLLVSLFVQYLEWEGVVFFQPVASFTLLKDMKILRKIQVIINPFACYVGILLRKHCPKKKRQIGFNLHTAKSLKNTFN